MNNSAEKFDSDYIIDFRLNYNFYSFELDMVSISRYSICCTSGSNMPIDPMESILYYT